MRVDMKKSKRKGEKRCILLFFLLKTCYFKLLDYYVDLI